MHEPLEVTVSGSLVKLSRLAQSFAEIGSLDQGATRACFDLAHELGATAIPLCIRELAADERGGQDDDLGDRQALEQALRRLTSGQISGGEDGARTLRIGWARALLLSLAEDPGVGKRVEAALARLAASATARVRLRARGLLTELASRGLDGPPALAADRAAGDRGSEDSHELDAATSELVDALLALSARAPGIAWAGHRVVSELDSAGMLRIVEAMAERAPGRALAVLDELLVRSDVDEDERGELRRIRAEARQKIDGPVRTRPIGGTPVGSAFTCSHPSGRCVVVVERWLPRTRMHRILCLLVSSDNELVDGLYRESRESMARCDIEREILALVRQSDHRVMRTRAAQVRELILFAAQATRTVARALPAAFYLGRDLLGLYDEHVPGRGVALADEPGLLLDRARGLLDAGEAARARPLLERVVVTSPDSMAGHASLARCLITLGDHGQAERALVRAAELAPDDASSHWNLAALAYAHGRLGRSYLAILDYLDLAGEFDGGHGDSSARREAARRFAAEYERIARLEYPCIDVEAVACADDLAQRAGEIVSAVLGGARAPKREDRLTRAIALLEQAIGSVTGHYGAWTWLGIAHRERGDHGAAELALRRAIELRPGHAQAVEALRSLGAKRSARRVRSSRPGARRARPRHPDAASDIDVRANVDVSANADIDIEIDGADKDRPQA